MRRVPGVISAVFAWASLCLKHISISNICAASATTTVSKASPEQQYSFLHFMSTSAQLLWGPRVGKRHAQVDVFSTELATL